MKKIIKYTSHRNDLFCEVGQCECPSPLFIGSAIEHLMKKHIKLCGYNDHHFFSEVNKDFRKYECKGCGFSFDYKWTQEGVEVANMPKTRTIKGALMTTECTECEKDFETDETLYTPTLCPECLDEYDGPGDEYYES